MGTRGSYGFYKNNINKLTYNHFDSYPTCLGANVVNFIKRHSNEELNNIFNSIKLVDEEDYPTEREALDLKQIGFGTEYKNKKLNWYEILGSHYGDLNLYSEGLTYMINHNDFVKDSLFCEWAYIINLDSNELEIYVGFQKEPDNNRYIVDAPTKSGYYNCKLIESIPLDIVRKSFELENLERIEELN